MATDCRITHGLVEVLRKGDPSCRITHGLVEVLREPSPGVRITHAVREVLRDGDPNLRITHALREVIRDGDPNLRITHAVREVLRGLTARSTTTTTTSTTTTTTVTGSTTTTTTVTTTTSTTVTTTTTTTIPPEGLEWGEPEPYDNVEKYPWSEWRTQDGVPARYTPVGGSSEGWGCLIIFPGETYYSTVKPIPAGSKPLRVFVNKYRQVCQAGNVNVYIRGDTSSFLWDDVSPSWNLYTSPTIQSWEYAQLKIEGIFTTTTTITFTTSTTTTT